MAVVRALAMAILSLALIIFAIVHGGGLAVAKVVERDAVVKSQKWARNLAIGVPSLPELVNTGRPTQEEMRTFETMRSLGELFRIKLFDRNGTITFVTDDVYTIGGPGMFHHENEVTEKVAEIIETGRSHIEVVTGESDVDHAEYFTRTYFPITNASGEIAGVMTIFLDQTQTKKRFEDSFRTYGMMLIAFVALVFAIPGTAFFIQRQIALRSKRSVEFLARYDPLTGLLNRRQFIEQAEILRSRKELTAVCYVDIDRFKSTNDAYGHARGDALLVEVSQALRKGCRSDDLIARFGGDEFVIALGSTSVEAAVMRMRSIVRQCNQDWSIDGLKISSSVSIGMAVYERDESLNDTLSKADAALYHIKASGRNELAVYGKEMGEELRRRHEMEVFLREATREKLFEIHYQPLVNVESHDVIGHEALLRLKNRDGTNIPPSTFIPMAEDLGLIDEIGRWTIENATRDMAARHGDKMLAINLSSAQFLTGDLIGIVQSALEASGLPAHCLELEITESLLLDDSVFVEMQIDTLKEIGISIVMDDFGTGFSSLSYLWKYGFDRLKIDRSFVAALEENPERSREIIETVIMLGARLDMKITAEGVETEAQSELLSRLGCDVLQGYLFGKAAPLHETQETPKAPIQEAS